MPVVGHTRALPSCCAVPASSSPGPGRPADGWAGRRTARPCPGGDGRAWLPRAAMIPGIGYGL